MLKKLSLSVATLVLAMHTGMASAEQIRVLSAFDQNFVFNKTMLFPLLEKIEKGTDGKLTFNFSGPEVVSTYEQFEPVQSGAFQMLFAQPGYYSGDAGVGVTIDAIDPDPKKRRETGVWDYLDKYYQTKGMKLIALQSQGEKALLFVTKNELPNTDRPFEGLKLRANVTYHGLVAALGGSSVLLAGGEIYPSLQAGLIDGAAWSVVGIVDFKLNEVAGYWTEPSYGQTGTTLLMNLDTWNSLDDETKKVIEEAALETELETMELYNKLNQEERRLMTEAGMKPTQFNEVAASKLDYHWAEGIWKLGVDKAGAEAEEFRAFAASKGMTPAKQ